MIQETLNWHKGEILEAKFILGFGIILLILMIVFYVYGNTPSAKALLIPFLVIGIFFSITGANMIYSNGKKISEVETIYQNDNAGFIKSEIKRVEDFQYLYPLSIVISLVSFVVALGLLYFVKNIHWQAIAISLILFGSAFAVIDYFSKERANNYYTLLLNEQKIRNDAR